MNNLDLYRCEKCGTVKAFPPPDYGNPRDEIIIWPECCGERMASVSVYVDAVSDTGAPIGDRVIFE